jgi:hypothetical protein
MTVTTEAGYGDETEEAGEGRRAGAPDPVVGSARARQGGNTFMRERLVMGSLSGERAS